MKINYLDEWVKNILADPITKEEKTYKDFKIENGILDARIFLENTYGFKEWEEGQDFLEYAEKESIQYKNLVENYKKEIEFDKSIYEYFKLRGDILDVGGCAGTTREHLKEDHRYVSIDPYINCLEEIPTARSQAYTCLAKKLNFIAAMAEFIPFKEKSFDWVHIRSTLDHIQVPDLAMKEARRVLKDDGSLLVGLGVEGGKNGKLNPKEYIKEIVRPILVFAGFKKYKDTHTFHPTFSNLKKIIEDNEFRIIDCFWQPCWNDEVVYIQAKK
tara:strand:- start:10363 stop:11178 length:816 start_codon:yes stop_codon:yes gene_type:complete